MTKSKGWKGMLATLATVTLLEGPAVAGPTAEQKCEGGKSQASGKYAACASKAEKGLVLKEDVDAYGSALAKCEEKLTSGFAKLEDKGGCPTTGDAAAVQEFQDYCAQSVAQTLADGTPLPDLGSCSTCLGDLATCGGDLGTCSRSLGTCNSDLSATNADLASCTGDLATAGSGTAAVGDVLGGKTFTSTAGVGATGTMPNNGAVTLTPTTSDQAIAAGYHDGSGKCAGDADLVAGNIQDGVNLFGVAGTLSAGGGLPKTGQTICDNEAGTVIACAGTGQDGELQKGTSNSFTDNGDGTINDNVSGLMWEKLDNNDTGGIHDWDTTYT